MNVWKCKLEFPTDTLQQMIETTDLKPFLAVENTSVIIILATTVSIIKIMEISIIQLDVQTVFSQATLHNYFHYEHFNTLNYKHCYTL